MLARVEAMPQFEFRGAEDPTSSAVYRAGKTPVTPPSHNSARHVPRAQVPGRASLDGAPYLSLSISCRGWPPPIHSTVGVRPFPLGAEAGYFTSTSEGEAWRLEVT
jgi:hypothetical protein